MVSDSSAQSKDVLLARMREELVALRGPLPQVKYQTMQYNGSLWYGDFFLQVFEYQQNF